jgi:gliding motility-associated-like protein
MIFLLIAGFKTFSQSPTATIVSTDAAFCESGNIELKIQLTGTFPFGLIYALYDENNVWFEKKYIISSNDYITDTDPRVDANKLVTLTIPTHATQQKYYIKVIEVFDASIPLNGTQWTPGTGSTLTSGQMNITVDSKPAPTVTDPSTQCGYTANLQALPDAISTTYHWEAPTGTFSDATSATPTFSANTAGLYNLTFIQDNGSCSVSKSAQVTLKGSPKSSISGSKTICSSDGTAYTMDIAVNLQGNAPFKYTLSDGTTNLNYTNISQLSHNQTVNATFNNQTYTITSLVDVNGCSAPAADRPGSAIVTDNKPDVSAGTDKAVCGNTTTLEATVSKGTSTWSTTGNASIAAPNSLSTNVTIDTYGPNLFNCTATYSGCSNDASVTIDFNPYPTFAITSAEPTLCESSPTAITFDMTGTAPWTVAYSDATDHSEAFATSPGNINISPTSTTTYTFNTIKDNNGCITTLSDTWKATVETLQTADAGDDINLDKTYSTTITANNTDVTGTWEILKGTSSIEATIQSNIIKANDLVVGENTFKWTITPVTCPSSSDEVSVFVANYTTYNGFSPNGDDINDVFVIDGAKSDEVNELSVFNTNGKLVYSQSNYQNNWDGKDNNGEPLSDGTYYYIFTSKNHSPVKDYVVIRRFNPTN